MREYSLTALPVTWWREQSRSCWAGREERTCVSHFVYRMKALCFSWQFPKQGTVLHIISLQNFADGLGESTKILAQSKDPPSPCGRAQQALLPGHSELRHLFWHPENSFWNLHETREVPIVGESFMKYCIYFLSPSNNALCRNRNGKFGTMKSSFQEAREIPFSGSWGNPIASPKPYFCSSCSYK